MRHLRRNLCEIFLYATVVGCGDFKVAMPPFQPGQAAAKAMELADADKNGLIAGAEFDTVPGLKASLPRSDSNSDQSLTVDEIKARINSYTLNDVVVMPISFTVTFNGQPLKNAEVTLVPEPFLESVISKASGRTDSNGKVMPIVLGLGVGGMLPGMYRVQVSQKDAAGNEMIPSQFNLKTNLGQEVALDLPTLERGAEIKLNN